ncbi:hypothetical protein Kpol_1018p54 [Vanderwaltozyma polyspora DSM 70294]|uniref:non-specific serine/threonine protein kinase n=1 Tax=Vanderwaltozyma polyspora (strain ATCC 22028 / DSM 70294 / BCRC 21397 / CBS 2163 / NBRC 10782 / NRRL Y-8283 / UCD 57-17) TaxID=436907 RepID=A7TDQ2_VANPO|nr:uncharacterized protein Kpol_1018p54 [Vanderwaltozyma polyspora DSM 70294]EDO19522.1 hypothetical protein Kpol_1018p54 [Vanderwaltozyma polyspora DSM 70294]
MSSYALKKHSPHDYIFKQELGHGSYSTVYKAVDKKNLKKCFAIKVCSKRHIIKENKVKYVTIEKNVLNSLGRENHPGIIKLYYTFHDQDNLYFVLSYAINGELLQLLHKMKTFNEVWSIHFCAQIIDALEFIHSKGIIHRDLKPENILLDKNSNLMITDFGAAYIQKNNDNKENITTKSNGSHPCLVNTNSSFVGTAEYVSPELLLYNHSGYGSDIWALGCMIFQFLEGLPPFRGENELKTFEKIVALEYKWSDQFKISSLVKDLVRKILTVNPQDRITLSEIKKHSWLNLVDWDNKQKIWSSVWNIPKGTNNLINCPPVSSTSSLQQNNSIINDRQLHVINTPLRNIPITKQKKKKKKPTKVSNTTSSIVEWRKRLGISSLNISNNSNSTANSNSSNSSLDLTTSNDSNPVTNFSSNEVNQLNDMDKVADDEFNFNGLSRSDIPPEVKKEHISAPINNYPLPKSASMNKIPTTPKYSQPSTKLKEKPVNPRIVKQELVYIHEIPYNEAGAEMSLTGYKNIDNDLITSLVSNHGSELRSSEDLTPDLLTLYKDGSLIYKTIKKKKNTNKVKSYEELLMVNIADSDLSMYDFEFNEVTKSGFLILEKYQSKIWFISLPLLNFLLPSTPFKSESINREESWVDCLFKSRQLLEDQQLITQMMSKTSIEQKVAPKKGNLEGNNNSYPATNTLLPSPPTSASSKKELHVSTNKVKQQVRRSSQGIPSNKHTVAHVSNSAPPSPGPSPNSTIRSHATKAPIKKYTAPSNMVISSSRYEVLQTLRKEGPFDPNYYKTKEELNTNQERQLNNYRTRVASSGASAAFKNLQKRRLTQSPNPN